MLGHLPIAWLLYPFFNIIKDLINRRGPLKEASIATIALDMAQGLHYMHSLNMLHRDIKPANILIDGRVRTTTA